MESHVLIPVKPMDRAGNQMFPGVLLHEVEAPGPVDCPGDSAGEWCVHGVEHDAFPLVNIQDPGTAQGPQVARLAPTLGIEGRTVQDHGESAIYRLAREDGSSEFLQIDVGFVEFLCQHSITFIVCKFELVL